MSTILSWMFGDWCGVCLTVTVLVMTWWVWTTFTSRRRLPPGPFPWPLLGNLPAIMTQPDFSYEYFRKLSHRYGPLLTMSAGPMRFVVINTFDGFKNTLMKYQTEFAGRPKSVSTDVLSEGGKSIAFGDYGPGWTLHRKLAMSALKHFASKDVLTELVNDEINIGMEQMTENNKVVDLHSFVYDILYGVLSKIIFGKDISRDQKDWLIENARDVNESFGQGFVQDLLPYWIGERVPTPAMNRMRKIIKKALGLFYKHIDEHRANFSRDNINDITGGILLAQLEEKEKGEENMKLITDTHIANTLSDIFFGASDTTAYTLLWTFLYLTKHPDVQEKLRVAVRDVAAERAVVLSDRAAMPYVEAVLNEVLRLRPTAPLALVHDTTCDVTVEAFGNTPECTIPEGTLVLPNIWSCHQDPAVWGDDYDQFRPERFLTEDGSKLVRREGLVPFSVGRRQCLGEQIARQDLFLLLAGIIQRVRIKSTGHLPGTDGNPAGGPFLLLPNRYRVVVEKL